jgi:hypothetical protein
MRQHILVSFGFVLLALGLLGPFTFADDLRHFGEISVAVGFALSGFFLLVPRLFCQPRCGNSFQLASPFVLLGLATGASMDKSALGLLVGVCVGLAAIWWHCSRYRRVAVKQITGADAR